MAKFHSQKILQSKIKVSLKDVIGKSHEKLERKSGSGKDKKHLRTK